MDKSGIYKNQVSKKINNNKKVYVGYARINKNNENIKRKIDNILRDNNFIYSKLIHIVLDGKVILKRIIGIKGDNIVTIDNEIIPFNNIDDVYI